MFVPRSIDLFVNVSVEEVVGTATPETCNVFGLTVPPVHVPFVDVGVVIVGVNNVIDVAVPVLMVGLVNVPVAMVGLVNVPPVTPGLVNVKPLNDPVAAPEKVTALIVGAVKVFELKICASVVPTTLPLIPCTPLEALTCVLGSRRSIADTL